MILLSFVTLLDRLVRALKDREHLYLTVSLGAPRPIVLTNWYFAAYDNHRKLSHIEGRPNVDYASFDMNGDRYYNTFPPFHVRMTECARETLTDAPLVDSWYHRTGHDPPSLRYDHRPRSCRPAS